MQCVGILDELMGTFYEKIIIPKSCIHGFHFELFNN